MQTENAYCEYTSNAEVIRLEVFSNLIKVTVSFLFYSKTKNLVTQQRVLLIHEYWEVGYIWGDFRVCLPQSSWQT